MKRKLVPLSLTIFVIVSMGPALQSQTKESPTSLSPEAAFATRVLAAKSGEEAVDMLRANKPLVNLALLKALADEASRIDGSAPRPEVERVNRIRLAAAEFLGDRGEIVEALYSLGNSLDGSAKVETLKRGLALSEETQNRRMTARYLVVIAGEQPTMDGQLEYYERALRMAKENDDIKLEGNILGRIGNLYTQKGDYITARTYHTRALAARERLNDLDGLSITHSNLGILEHIQGNFEAAIQHYQKAIDLSERVGNKVGIAIDSYNLGNVYLVRRDFTRAMNLYSKSLALAEELKCRGCVIGASINVANLYVEQGNAEQARSYLRKAVDTDDEALYPSYALGTLADSYRIDGDLDKAIAFSERLLQLKEKENPNPDQLAETLNQIGQLDLANSNPEKAEQYFRRVLAIRNQLGDLGWAFRSTLGLAQTELYRKRFEGALRYAREAQTLNSDSPDGTESWELYATFGRAFKGLGEPKEAQRHFEKAIQLIEATLSEVAGDQSEKQKFFGDKVDVYFDMIDLMLSIGKTAEAMEYAERLKARALLATIRNGKVDISRGLSVEEKNTERRLLNELVSLRAQIEKLAASGANETNARSELIDRSKKKRLEFEDFRNKLYAQHPATRIDRGGLESWSIDNVRSAFSVPGTVIIEYSSSKDSVTGFVVNSDRSRPSQIGVFNREIKQVRLRSAIQTLTKQFAEGSLDFRNGAREMYDLLLKPFEAEFRGKTRVIIVPDGPLWDLPFQALMDEKGKFLAEKIAVSYAPSLTALNEMKKKAAPRRSKRAVGAELIAFGNPIVSNETTTRVKRVFMSEKLDPLPEAERLVNGLGKMYGASKSKVYVGAAAREEVAKKEAGNYRIVQFATHGILNNASPMYSYLVFAKDDKNPNEDGLLEAWELKDLDLNADMIILSACDTARGRISAGEGIIGMTWASFIAGAPTTVASQWKVESSSTTELMFEFHRQLLSGKVSKAEALRRAQLKLMRNPKYRHPSYWGAWVIVGDAS